MRGAPKYAGMAASLPASHRDGIQRLADGLGLSLDGALALAMANEAIRDYCPVEEKGKVVAALFGLENRRRTTGTDL